MGPSEVWKENVSGRIPLKQLVIVNALTLAVLSTLLLIAAHPAQAQTETVLYNFCSQPNCSDGGNPNSNLTPDGAGNYYGMTEAGGAGALYNQWGTVFEISPNGSGGWNETVLYSFTNGTQAPCAPSASCPSGISTLVFDSVGNLYGIAWDQQNGYPTNAILFELSPVGGSWVETTAFTFTGSDSIGATGGLVMDASGNIYGTNGTKYINNASTSKHSGSIFELSPSGSGWTEQVLYTRSNVRNGITSMGPTMDAAGNIYAVIASEVVKLSPNGDGWTSTMIHGISGWVGETSPPVVDNAGNIYGTFASATAKSCSQGGCGRVYKLIPGAANWTYEVIHTFGSTSDGIYPQGNLVLDAAGNIYGATQSGGEYDDGTVFKLVHSKTWKYTEQILCSFNGTDGGYSVGGLTMDSEGNLYGTTLGGGSSNMGVAFEVTP